MVPLSWIHSFGFKGEVSDNCNSYDGARKSASFSKYSSFKSEEKFNDGCDGNLMGDYNDWTSLASVTEIEKRSYLTEMKEEKLWGKGVRSISFQSMPFIDVIVLDLKF